MINVRSVIKNNIFYLKEKVVFPQSHNIIHYYFNYKCIHDMNVFYLIYVIKIFLYKILSIKINGTILKKYYCSNSPSVKIEVKL